MEAVIDLFLHLDAHLAELTTSYGPWIYAILFAIIFAETGLVVTPFLPGDSLLFACGALAARDILDPWLTFTLLLAAAITGNLVNYSIGRYVGPRVFSAADHSSLSHRLLNREHLDRTHAFFEKYGGMAVVAGRFMPIVRTFVPFVAGAGAMTYTKFALYNLVGGLLWTGVCFGAGMLFGNVPIVRDNFSLVAIGIVLVSVLPIAFELLKKRREPVAAPDRT
jgi:membrane-associated protein